MHLPVSLLLLAAVSAQTVPDFERDIKPLLTAKCAPCHNAQKPTSGLDILSRRVLLTGGNRGPALQAERPDDSLLLKAIRHEGDLKMPPGAKLRPAQIATIERWVRQGAKMPEAGTTNPAAARHWAFQPVRRAALPAVRDTHWPRTDVDRFVLARLERERLAPSPEADPITLLRRVHLDLTGLPPTPAEIDEYLADMSQDRYQRLVDRLLASPHYGERWARHWLDQARYADSDGGSRDEPREIWKYREWVIQAFNRDLPFNQFVIEQIAGDLLPNATVDQKVATGFHRNSPLQIEAGTDREEFRTEAVMDRVDTTGTVFLGLSTGCARCHDHKYDPVSQREYYQLFAFFNNVDEYGPEIAPFSETNDLQLTHAPLLSIGSADQTAKWDAVTAQLQALYRERYAYRGGDSNVRKGDEGDKLRTATIDALKKQRPQLTVAMVMNERAQPRDTYILLGGDYRRRGARVQPGVPSALHPILPRADGKPLNRLDLANWVVDPKNPLAARVAVNRIWQRYFGRGLVETENDFGAKGAPPSHPELLDWLASEFVDKGWSQKALHRLIVTSAVYRQSSRTRPELETKDPDNRLLARQSRLRLEGEIVRDAGLSASGLLSRKLGGPSVFPPQPEGVMETGQVKQSWRTSSGEDRYRRALYTFHYRVTPNPAMTIFDGANGLLPCTRRARTNTPLQALTLLNDPNFHEMAQAFAKRIVAQPEAERLDRAFQTALARKPAQAERERLARLLSLERDAFQTQPAEAELIAGKGATPELASWVALCRVLLNTDEFLTRE
jgi:hypothetical protein